MEQLNAILNQFQIPNSDYAFSTISNGFINDTYLVSKQEKPTYILQRINTSIFENVNAIIHNIDAVLPLLKHENYSTITLVKSTSDTSFFKTEDAHVWRLMSFIPESTVHNTTDDPKVAFEAGRIIGLFHSLLENYDASKLEDTLPQFHDVSFRHQQFTTALANANPKNIATAQKAITFVNDTIASLTSFNPNELPIRACHNDTKLNNILFSKDNTSLCLIDLDTIMKGTFLYDFGDAIRTIVNPAAEDEKNLSLIKFNTALFDAFIEGLISNGNFLSKKEADLLPIAAVLMPFLHGIRALTDYLENNRYYKVSYETQNLDRSFSLFAFAQLAIDNKAAMQKSITQHLS